MHVHRSRVPSAVSYISILSEARANNLSQSSHLHYMSQIVKSNQIESRKLAARANAVLDGMKDAIPNVSSISPDQMALILPFSEYTRFSCYLVTSHMLSTGPSQKLLLLWKIYRNKSACIGGSTPRIILLLSGTSILSLITKLRLSWYK